MLSSKCSLNILCLLLIFPSLAFSANYDSKQCLMSKFDTTIKQEGKFFGLLKQSLQISKDQCQIEIVFKKILETKWNIDICREPVHIKVTSNGSQSVYKKAMDCSKDRDQKDNFCIYWNELNMIIQDDGLIFAEGERETLDTSHGKTYCSYLLLKKYINDGVIFSKYKTPRDIFDDQDSIKDESCAIPEKKIVEPKASEVSVEVEEALIDEPKESEDSSSGPF